MREMPHEAQTDEIVALIRSHMDRVEAGACSRRKISDRRSGPHLQGSRSDRAGAARGGDSLPRCRSRITRDRPEVLDALALARALFNPEDRVAWLGVLRAPWCGLSLADLHKLTSADDAEALLRRPVPELLAARLHLLSNEGREAATTRVIETLDACGGPARAQAGRLARNVARTGVAAPGRRGLRGRDRTRQPRPALGSASTNLAVRRAGSAWDADLAAALEATQGAARPRGRQRLRRAVDEHSQIERAGVRGRDRARSAGAVRTRTNIGLLSWLERGLGTLTMSGDITEFLVAPLPLERHGKRQGEEVGRSRLSRERESQETRRILYVAATRAREELHLFARPEYKVEHDGSFTLCDPRESLLATAWPALEGGSAAAIRGLEECSRRRSQMKPHRCRACEQPA